MNFPKNRLAVAVGLSLALAACGGDDEVIKPVDDGTGAPENAGGTDNTVRYYLLATDDAGYVNVIADTGMGSINHAQAIAVANQVKALGEHPDHDHGTAVEVVESDTHEESESNTVELGEVVINTFAGHDDPSAADDHSGHKAFVIIRNGLVNDQHVPVGGGYGVIDMAAVSSMSETAPEVSLHSLATNLHGGQVVSVLNHVVPEVKSDGSSNYLWVMNDGPSVDQDADDAAKSSAAMADSVFRVNWDHHDQADLDTELGVQDDAYGDSREIAVGNGYKSAAFAPVSDSHNFVFVLNSDDRTVSVIDNIPGSASFQKVVKTIDLSAGGVPQGITYSAVSGGIYIGIANSQNAGLMMIDARQEPEQMTAQLVATGNGAAEIPGSEFLRVNSSGRWLFVAGYKAPAAGQPGAGYVTIVDAGLADSVANVQGLGDFKPGKVDVASIHADEQDTLRLFISSQEGGANDNTVAVVDVDSSTGLLNGDVTYLNVGRAGEHRQTAISADNRRIYFSFEGSCTAADHGHADGVAHDHADEAPAVSDGSATDTHADDGHAHADPMPDMGTGTSGGTTTDSGTTTGGATDTHADDGHTHTDPATDTSADSGSGGATADGGATTGGTTDVHLDDGHTHTDPAADTSADGGSGGATADSGATTGGTTDVHVDDGHTHADPAADTGVDTGSGDAPADSGSTAADSGATTGGTTDVHVDDGHTHTDPVADTSADTGSGGASADSGSTTADSGTTADTGTTDTHVDDGHTHTDVSTYTDSDDTEHDDYAEMDEHETTYRAAVSVEGSQGADTASVGGGTVSAMCGTIVAVDVLTKEVSAPVMTIGSMVKGMAVYVVPGLPTLGEGASSGAVDTDHADDGHSHDDTGTTAGTDASADTAAPADDHSGHTH